MKARIISIKNIYKEDGRYYVEYAVEYENGEVEHRAKVLDTFREAGISKNELKVSLNKWKTQLVLGL